MLSITQVKEMCDVSTRKIRHYLSIGLVDHEIVNSGSKKYFQETIIQELKLISDLRELGFSLDEIGIILNKNLISTIDFKKRLTASDKKNIIKKYEKFLFLAKELEDYFKCLR